MVHALVVSSRILLRCRWPDRKLALRGPKGESSSFFPLVWRCEKVLVANLDFFLSFSCVPFPPTSSPLCYLNQENVLKMFDGGELIGCHDRISYG